MRNSVFLGSALAMGAVAMPWLDDRAVHTVVKVETAIETVVVFTTVTRSAPLSRSSSSFVSQPPIRTSSGPGSQPSGIAAPDGTSLVSSFSSATSSSASRPATIAPVGTSTRASSSASAASIASIAASPLQTSSTAATPTSSQVSPASITSTAPTVGPSHLSGPQQAYLSAGPDYQNAILFHHNEARANHRAAPLVWNATCASNAAQAANTCNFAHYIPPGVSNGQNLFTVSGTVFNVTAGITESWYKGEFPAMEPHFGQANLDQTTFEQVGHLTQVVWQGTTSVGCVSIDCGDHMQVNGATGSSLNKFTVCNYYPPGNIVGQYDTGVLPPISTTNLGSWTD